MTGENVEKSEPVFMARGTVKWYDQCGKQPGLAG